MNDSILYDIKKLLGIAQEYDAFDQDLIMHINSVLNILVQQGIGKPGFYVTCGNTTWKDFLEDTQVNLYSVKSWVGLKVRMMFDPPLSSLVADAINANLKELEWRMYITENYVGEI